MKRTHRSSFVLALAAAAFGAACRSPSSSPSESGATPSHALAGAGVVETPRVAEIGAPAPHFALRDTDGRAWSSSELRGKTVVLEWFNPGCPFVERSHDVGTLARYPETARAEGVVWLAINSSAPGKQGHGLEDNRKAKAKWSISYPLLIDQTGEVGRRFGAKTTPHLFVIAADGTLAYEGAIDNAPHGEPESGELVNYVQRALGDAKAGAVRTPRTKPYGCNVKYAD